MILRCSKCGSDAGFLLETRGGRTVEARGPVTTERIRQSVLVTCTYCNHRWDHVPIELRDKRLDEVTQQVDLQH